MASRKAPPSPGAEPRFFYGYVVVVAAFLIMMVVYGLYNVFGLFFKPLLTEFGWTRATTSGAFSLCRLLQGVFAVGMGTLSDRLGPRVVMTLCGLVVGLGYLLMSRIGAMWQLYLFYGVVIAIGMSGAFVSLTSTVARWFVEKRTMMTGVVMTGGGIGTLIASPVVSRLIAAYDWRVSYIILGSVLLAVMVLAAQLLRRDPTQMGQRAYGENVGQESTLKPGTESFSLKQAVPTRRFWLLLAMSFSLGFCMLTVLVHIVPHATDLGMPAVSAANVLATMGGVSIAGRVFLGSAGDRLGNKNAFAIGFILISGALFWLVSATGAPALHFFAAAYGGCVAVQSPLVAGLFGLRSHGLILAAVNFGFTIGGAGGPFIAGYIFDVTGSYRLAFLLCAAFGTVAVILSILLTPTKRSQVLPGSRQLERT